jgi:hypothetical protein
VHGHQSANGEEVKDAVSTWLSAHVKTFFLNFISKPVDLINKCVEKLEDFIEKLQYINSCVPFVD